MFCRGSVAAGGAHESIRRLLSRVDEPAVRMVDSAGVGGLLGVFQGTPRSGVGFLELLSVDVAELRRERWGGIEISASGVYRVLRRHGLNTRAKRLSLVNGCVIDAAGNTVMPGLIATKVHLLIDPRSPFAPDPDYAQLALLPTEISDSLARADVSDGLPRTGCPYCQPR